MAAKISIYTGGGSNVAHGEVNGGWKGYFTAGTRKLTIGAIKSAVYYLTIKRLKEGTIKIASTDADLELTIDGSNKIVKKGQSFALPSTFSRAIIREKVVNTGSYHSLVS